MRKFEVEINIQGSTVYKATHESNSNLTATNAALTVCNRDYVNLEANDFAINVNEIKEN
jgi:hypothetical protein